MKNLCKFGPWGVLTLFSVLNGVWASPAVEDNTTIPMTEARSILETAGVRGGLCVHLGCGDGRLTVALRRSGFALVQGMETDPARIARARKRWTNESGSVVFEVLPGKALPFTDNLVNLVVCDRPGIISATSMSEILRILVPGGVACIHRNGKWEKIVKPQSKETDEWTHFMHGPGGNAVANDRVVAPPQRVQWIAPPRHTRGHEFTPSIAALVSAAGRIFYIADEAPVDSITVTPRWYLVARDAYNGLLLWQRKISSWYPHLFNWGTAPTYLQRRVVAEGGHVFATLGLVDPVSVLDAVTGKVIKLLDLTRGAEEIICHRGILLVVARDVTSKAIEEQKKIARLARRGKSPLFKRETAEPLVKEFRQIEFNSPPRRILALDVATGRLLWKKEGREAARIRYLSLCAAGNQVYYQLNQNVIALDLKTGAKRWSTRASSLRLVSGNGAVVVNKKTVGILSIQDGSLLWSKPLRLCSVRDAFVIGDSLWLGGFKPFSTGRKYTGPVWGPYFAVQRNLGNGEIVKEIAEENPGHHHRCWQNKATNRFIIAGRRGAEFLDLDSGDVLWNSWVRGVCRYGTLPCNGLLYAPPHSCGCYVAAKLDGFYALSGKGLRKPARSRDRTAMPETGPAFSTRPGIDSPPDARDWPTYRHDAGRSGAIKSSVPSHLRLLWSAEVSGSRCSSLVVAGGNVFTADVANHKIVAMDAKTGRIAWKFTASARIDSPPAFFRSRVLFGCRDGYLYSVRASDGALAWRLRLAPENRLIVARGQIESVSPVFGSVLIRDGVVFATAGRSSYLDGGIVLYRVDPNTGRILSSTVLYSPNPKTGKQPKQQGPSVMPGALADILSSDSEFVYLRDTVFDKQGRRVSKGSPHLFTLTGFLDDTWPHRSYWCYATRPSLAIGCGRRERKLVYGRLLCFDDRAIYGYGRANVHWSNMLRDGQYRLFAVTRNPRTIKWQVKTPIRVLAMAVAGDTILACGPVLDKPGEVAPLKPGPGALLKPERVAPMKPGPGALLMEFSARDGSELSRFSVDDIPAFDGMAVARGRVYIAARSGRILCLGVAAP